MEKPKGEHLFSTKDIVRLMLPLLVETLLNDCVGIADSVMVSGAGDTAVSAVSLVDQVNILILRILAALSTGGSVIAAQYMGKKKSDSACVAADQLVISTVGFSLTVMALMLIGGRWLLGVIFGQAEDAVMDQAVIYCFIVSFSFPFLSMFNSGSAIFRSRGDSRTGMAVSFMMNIINLSGNALLIFVFKMGVAGAAIATLASRIIGGLLIYIKLRNPSYEIHCRSILKIRPDISMIKKILYIGIPTGLENGMFQLGKVCVLSLVSSCGTAQIMANSVTNSITNFMILPGMAISLTLVTVVGQCIGAGDTKQARYYTNRLLLLSTVLMFAISAVMVLARPALLSLYSNMSRETYDIANWLIFTHMVAGLIWPVAFNLPNVFKAANDVKYSMVVTMLSMWIFRVGLSYFFNAKFGLGVLGVWYAMYIDWAVRSVFFAIRYRSDRWHRRKLV